VIAECVCASFTALFGFLKKMVFVSLHKTCIGFVFWYYFGQLLVDDVYIGAVEHRAVCVDETRREP
jgi:hypothetical protein